MTSFGCLVSWHFPPYRASSGFNLFKRLRATDYVLDVIQAERQVDQSNLGMLEDAGAVFRQFPLSVRNENAYDGATRAAFVEAVVEQFDELVKSRRYDFLLTHSHEFVSHLAGLEIKRRYPDLPWIASFGDPIAANPYNLHYDRATIDDDVAAEREVVRRADRVVTTNRFQTRAMVESISEADVERKFHEIHHAYARELYPQALGRNSRFTFRHVGMLYKHKRTAEPFVDAARLLLSRRPELKDRMRIEFYGANDRFIEGTKADPVLGEVVSYRGQVSYLTSLRLMQSADALLLREGDFSGEGISFSPFFPGKLVDYLGAGKPMVAVTMDEGFVPDLMARIGMPAHNENDHAGIADSMARLIDGTLKLDGRKLPDFSSEKAAKTWNKILPARKKKTLLFAGHDFKFCREILAYYRNSGRYDVLMDKWEGHGQHDLERSRELLDRADIIFCEWGLGNARWYSREKKAGQRLIIRMHRQEIETIYIDEIAKERVDRFIFVSPHWAEKFVRRLELDRSRISVIANLVDVDRFSPGDGSGRSRYRIGMQGYVPRLKRLDRAIDLLLELRKSDDRYHLSIKGKSPEDLRWMHSRAWRPELEWYRDQMKRIEQAGLTGHVVFEPHSPDIENWYRELGFILSLSDFESFHLACAEGMAAGAIPAIRGWPGAGAIYPKELIHANVGDLARFILDRNESPPADDYRDFAVRNFGAERALARLAPLIDPDIPDAAMPEKKRRAASSAARG